MRSPMGPPDGELVLATRGSRLAVAQAQWVATVLQKAWPALSVRLLLVRTRGDQVSARTNRGLLHRADEEGVSVAERAEGEAGGTGEFVREVQRAVLDGRAHAAVHSLKDLPLRGPEELVLAAVPVRGDVREALISREAHRLAELPSGSRVGTSSPRRRVFLTALRPDLEVIGLRGNLDTRLRRLAVGYCDAILVAAAGLSRLGLTDRVSQYLLPEEFLPAPGQGALAVEVAAGDEATLSTLKRIDDPRTRQAVTAERSMLEALGGGCRVPVGAWARREEGDLILSGAHASPQVGVRRVTVRCCAGEHDLEAARRLGRQAGEYLVEKGAYGG